MNLFYHKMDLKSQFCIIFVETHNCASTIVRILHPTQSVIPSKAAKADSYYKSLWFKAKLINAKLIDAQLCVSTKARIRDEIQI